MIYNIKSKAESDAKIRQLGLNRMLEEIFYRGQYDDVVKFIFQHDPYRYFNIRDKAKSSGDFICKVRGFEILPILKTKNYDKFAIYGSLAVADEYLALQGEIIIDKSFNLLASLSNIPFISNREAMQTPIFHLNIDLKEGREPRDIRGLTEIINYIVKHELIGVVVEFSMFDVPVGIYQENIIIWELRNY